MVYRAIGIWDGQDGSAMVFTEFLENAGSWSFEIKADADLVLANADSGKIINQFIEENGLQFKVALISVYSEKNIHGGAIAAITNLPVITGLSDMDMALGGNGDFLTSSSSKLQINSNSLSTIDKAVCAAFAGVLRWREEYNFLSSVTGASRNNVGGALWMGQEA